MVQSVLENGIDGRQLVGGIDREDILGRDGRDDLYSIGFLLEFAGNSGQVVLARDGIGFKRFKSTDQVWNIEARVAWIDFSNAPLFIGRIAILDDGVESILFIPDDAAIAGGILQNGGRQRGRASVAA